MKVRMEKSGIHLFDRSTGTNILLDEIQVPEALWHRCPRFLSVALTNACNLTCSYCYAPKHRSQLDPDLLLDWLVEYDRAGGLSVGFGGGEPTLYPGFSSLCQAVHRQTELGISFTTHGHQLTHGLLESIQSVVQFVRVSVDGVLATYELLRGRSFSCLTEKLKLLSQYFPFGINTVVNARTVGELGAVAQLAADLGASELLLLPELDKRLRTSEQVLGQLRTWIVKYEGPLRLSITQGVSSVGFPVCDPFEGERSLQAYAHIDASGVLRRSSFADDGIALDQNGFLSGLAKLVG